MPDALVETVQSVAHTSQYQPLRSRFHDKAAVAVAQARLVHLHVLAIGSGWLDVAVFLFAVQYAEHFCLIARFEQTFAFFAAVVFQPELLLAQIVAALAAAVIVNRQNFALLQLLYAQLPLKLQFVLLTDYSVFQAVVRKVVNALSSELFVVLIEQELYCFAEINSVFVLESF
ncbi:Uncharacterised protein [Acinetobacter baumannii]|nr:Uncharacterised protein [Acinetobacter baumannii]SSR74333.1 Uncharacterised protein [Acinetobacter baumannii]